MAWSASSVDAFYDPTRYVAGLFLSQPGHHRRTPDGNNRGSTGSLANSIVARLYFLCMRGCVYVQQAVEHSLCG